jgi:hypothetical protein
VSTPSRNQSGADAWSSASTPVRGVPQTAFNFTASHWDASQRARRTGLFGSVAVVLALSWIVWGGLTARSAASSSQTERSATAARAAKIEQDIKALTGGTDDLGKLLAERQGVLDYVFSQDVSEFAVMEIVNSSLVSGVTVRTIAIEKSATVATTSQKAYPTIFALKVTADAESLDAPAAWQQALLALQGSKLVNPDVQFSVTSGTNVSITVSAGLVDDAVLVNRASVRAVTGKGQSK